MLAEAHTVLSACLVSIGASALGLCVLVPISRPAGLLDYPNARKRHQFATPLVGGLAVFVGLLAGWFWLGRFHRFDSAVLGTAFVLVVLGALDRLLACRFDVACRKFGYGRRGAWSLDCTRFTPPRTPSPQGQLFGA